MASRTPWVIALYVVVMILALGRGIERADAEPGSTDLSAAFRGISE